MSILADLAVLDGVLPNDEVHVWQAHLGVAQDYVTSLVPFLDATEQERASRFKVAWAREQFVISHAFVRLALAKYLQVSPDNVRFLMAEYGKPELVSSRNIKFNLAHTKGVAVIAIARERVVGVDVEAVRETVEVSELADRFFSPKEAQWLRSQPASDRVLAFFDCWTAKEAYIKAKGMGLSIPLAKFAVIPDPGNERFQLEVFDDPESSKNWSIWRLNLGQALRGALAVEGQGVAVRLGTWSWPTPVS